MYQALALPPVDPDLLAGISQALARLCHSQAVALSQLLSSGIAVSLGESRTSSAALREPSLDDESLLFNLLLLASFLPADGDLFTALKEIQNAGLRPSAFTAGRGRTARQLRQALTLQQVDESLEEFWFGLIGVAPHFPRLTAILFT